MWRVRGCVEGEGLCVKGNEEKWKFCFHICCALVNCSLRTHIINPIT